MCLISIHKQKMKLWYLVSVLTRGVTVRQEGVTLGIIFRYKNTASPNEYQLYILQDIP